MVHMIELTGIAIGSGRYEERKFYINTDHIRMVKPWVEKTTELVTAPDLQTKIFFGPTDTISVLETCEEVIRKIEGKIWRGGAKNAFIQDSTSDDDDGIPF